MDGVYRLPDIMTVLMRSLLALGLLPLVAFQGAASPVWRVHAVRYATIADFPVSSLVLDADRSRRMDIAMMFWLLERDDARAAVVDAGFYREKFIERWKPRDFVRPTAAVVKAGVRPDLVMDVIVSHVHWDIWTVRSSFPARRCGSSAPSSSTTCGMTGRRWRRRSTRTTPRCSRA